MTQEFNDAFENIPAVSVDFGMMHVAMKCDFSKLNPNTKHISVPINGSGYDITNKANQSNFDGYKYPETLEIVTTYVATGTQITCNGYTFNTGVTENTSFTYVMKSNTDEFGTYYDTRKKDAVRQIFISKTGVALTQENIEGLSSLTNEKFDFISAEVSNDVIAGLSNTSVKYIALPGSAASTIDGSANECAYSTKCSALLCIGALNGTKFTSWSRPNDVTSGIKASAEEVAQQAPSVQKVTDIIGKVSTYTEVNMSGCLCNEDIKANATPGGLNGAKSVLAKGDFENAVFMPNSEMSFSRADWGQSVLTSMTLPTSSSQTLMPDSCLAGFGLLDELCIPYNIKNIGNYACNGMGGRHITTTDADGNVIDNGDYTYTFSESLESIGEFVFWTEKNKLITDIYVLGTDAPTCEAYAFSPENYVGSNGYDSGSHPISRNNYKNGNIWITILHLPSGITEDQAKHYTDVDRVYSLADETSAFNDDGTLKYWPNQSEFCRAYNLAVSGKTWNDWPTMNEDQFNTTVSSLASVMVAQGYTQAEADAYVATLEWDAANNCPIPSTLRYTDGGNVSQIASKPNGDMNGLYTADNVYELQPGATESPIYHYIGWHQFVLTDYYQAPEEEQIITNYTKLDYYTLCIPYDMTREEVISLLGAPAGTNLDGTPLTEDAFPEVYTLKSVTRNSTTKSISLGFSKELMAIAKGGKDIAITLDATDDKGWNYNATLKTKGEGENKKDVYIKGGYPYLIKPIVPVGTTFSNLGQYILSNSDFTEEDLGWTQTVGDNNAVISVPYNNHGVISRDENNAQLTWKDENNQEHNYYYFFQGTYVKEELPIYTYYLGQSTNGTRNFFYDKTGTRTWNPFSAIIGGKCPNVNPVAYIGLGYGTTSSSYVTPSILIRNSFDAEFPTTQNVKINFTFEDENGFDEAVSIEKIDGEAIGTDMIEGNVYSLTGQYVGKSVNGLSKGLYIVNGKKVLVK